jgi:hypothetical protein
MIKICALLFAAVVLLKAGSLQAVQFYGVKVIDKERRVITEKIQRFIESKNGVAIVFSNNSAFYTYSKDKETLKQLKIFLNERIKNQKTVRAEVNLTTAEIAFIGDLQ